MYTNHLINGNNGEDLSILAGDGINFTNFYIHDLVSIEDLSDQREDLIMLESEATEIVEEDHTWFEYNTSLTTYFINGTKTNSIPLHIGDIWDRSKVPDIELFNYYGEPHLLYIDSFSLILFNMSMFNFLDPIYNITFNEDINQCLIIEDLNLDGVSDMLTSNWKGKMFLLNGNNGEIIMEFTILPEDINLEETHSEIYIIEIHSAEGDGISYILSNGNYRYDDGIEEKVMQVYSLDLTSENVTWEIIKHGEDIEAEVFVLNQLMK